MTCFFICGYHLCLFSRGMPAFVLKILRKKLPELLFLSGERGGIAASVWCLGACWGFERLFGLSAPVFGG